MNLSSSLCGFSAFLATASIVSATITFEVQVELLQDFLAGDPAPGTTNFFLLADTDRNGFAPVTASTIGTGTGNLLGDEIFFDGTGGDDLAIWRSDLIVNGAGLISDLLTGLSLGTYNGKSWEEGDPLALLWFPALTATDNTITVGMNYGRYTDAAPIDGDSWSTPADGTLNHRLYAFSESANTLPPSPPGAISDSLLVADLNVVPEPSFGALFVGFMAALTLFKRRGGSSWH